MIKTIPSLRHPTLPFFVQTLNGFNIILNCNHVPLSVPYAIHKELERTKGHELFEFCSCAFSCQLQEGLELIFTLEEGVDYAGH